ncbi:MAG: DUF1501 domain-containing protein, partial [Planctomycetia bacterium]
MTRTILDSTPELTAAVSRRALLKGAGAGFGMVGLAALLHREQAAGATADLNPLAPKKPHFPAKAKRVIWLFINGGPSHVDTWDYKPGLEKWNGKTMKE